MKTRKLGDTDLDMTIIGFGTWAIGGGNWGMGWGDQDERDSIAAIHEGLDQGINWIDTAYAYGFGESEEVVGKAVREYGGDVIVATKCGVLSNEDRSPYRLISRKTILEEVEGSLRRLQTDCIDLYQLHWPEPPENVEEGWQTLLDLKQQGKIRWAGVCNFYEENLTRAEALGHVSSIQPQYSILDRRVEAGVVEWCREKNTGFLGYSPMHSGLLTGKVSREWYDGLPGNDWRKHKEGHPVTQYLQEPHMDHFLAFVDELRSIAGESSHTVGQLAVSWVLSHSEVTSTIVGARRPGQISETAQAADWELSSNELERIEKAYTDFLVKVG
ncbi:MAG: aldo/keto reductase [Opitutales bacterium]|nr:aldo/keto reductase [Opitutales bacterium]